jgi:adenylate kinase family enzyme
VGYRTWYIARDDWNQVSCVAGPSGSGKSTVAKRLLESADRRTALIAQDYYRFIFNPADDGSKANSDTIHKMIKTNTLLALADGYDVILEGILSARSYAGVLDAIFQAHPRRNFVFYFDVSFKETIKRHEIRRTPDHKFTDQDMKEWYPGAHRSGHEFERIIPENLSIAETVQFIQTVSAA